MLLLLLTLSAPDLSAQSRRNRRGNGPVYGARIEKQVTLPDSTTLARRDSLRQVDSLRRADSVALLGKSSLDVPAFSHAQDSMISDFSNGNRKIFYYGSTSVKYQDMELTADYMEYDMNAGTVYAHGVYDSLNGVWNGQPVMKQGNQTYNMEEVRYNFNSRKARIKNMITNDAEGILHGRDIKMMDDHSINLEHGKYTVCDDENPHYYINLTMGKVISETKTTVFGPAYLVVEDVHIPFLMLPFGFIPKRPQRATGLLMPSFGEEERRGFYMRDLGMYFVFGNHFDLSLTGSYYTLGSWNVELNSRYRVNYKFSGKRAVAGLSMGGFGTLYHALKYPTKYTYAYSMSPASSYDLFAWLVDSQSSKSVFPSFTIEVGNQDTTVGTDKEDNEAKRSADYMTSQGLEVEYVARDGGHTWDFWRACLPKALKKAGESFQ